MSSTRARKSVRFARCRRSILVVHHGRMMENYERVGNNRSHVSQHPVVSLDARKCVIPRCIFRSARFLFGKQRLALDDVCDCRRLVVSVLIVRRAQRDPLATTVSPVDKSRSRCRITRRCDNGDSSFQSRPWIRR